MRGNVHATRLELVLAHALDELHGEDGVGARLGHEAREVDVGVPREVGGEATVVRRFIGEMDLRLDRVAERLQRLGQRHEPQRRHDALREPADEEQDRAIEPDLVENVGAAHLDGHRLTGGAPDGAMHLRHRRGSDRLGLEAREQCVERPAELALDDAPHVVEGEGRDLIAQPCQLVDQRTRQQVGACGRDLPHLDERRPEPRAHVDECRAERAGETIARAARGHGVRVPRGRNVTVPRAAAPASWRLRMASRRRRMGVDFEVVTGGAEFDRRGERELGPRDAGVSRQSRRGDRWRQRHRPRSRGSFRRMPAWRS